MNKIWQAINAPYRAILAGVLVGLAVLVLLLWLL